MEYCRPCRVQAQAQESEHDLWHHKPKEKYLCNSLWKTQDKEGNTTRKQRNDPKGTKKITAWFCFFNKSII